jgi:hypothetical protein
LPLSKGPQLEWYQRLWEHIRREAKAAAEADLFASAEALHINLIGASTEHLVASAETAEDLATVVQIIRAAEAAALARPKLMRPTIH